MLKDKSIKLVIKKSYILSQLIILMTIIMILGMCILNSCKKGNVDPVEQPQSDLIKISKGYLNSRVNVISKLDNKGVNSSNFLSVAQRINIMSSGLSWDSAEVFKEKNLEIAIVPCLHHLNKLLNKKYIGAKYMIFFKNSQDSIKMRVMEILFDSSSNPANIELNIIKNIFSNFYFQETKYFNSQISASVILYDDNYKTLSTSKITKGNFHITKILLENKQVQSKQSKILAPVYETWYTVGYWYDLATGEIVSAEIIDEYTVCISDCPAGDNPYGDYLPGGSGSDCDLQAGLDAITTGGAAVNSLISSSVTVDLTTRRTKIYKWKCYLSLTWSLVSYEKGTQIAAPNSDPQKQWNWESLEHQSVALEGTVVGGSITPTSLYGNATIGTYWSMMEVGYNYKAEIMLCGNAGSRTISDKSAIPLNVND